MVNYEKDKKRKTVLRLSVSCLLYLLNRNRDRKQDKNARHVWVFEAKISDKKDKDKKIDSLLGLSCCLRF